VKELSESKSTDYLKWWKGKTEKRITKILLEINSTKKNNYRNNMWMKELEGNIVRDDSDSKCIAIPEWRY
jgi:hypothetical protein